MRNNHSTIISRWLVTLTLVFIVGCSSPGEKTGAGAAKVNEIKPATHSVEIAMMKFTPANLHVRNGDTIVFVNNDIVAHDITEEKSKAWSSSPLPAGNKWVMVATVTAGYYCSIHPVMKGKIIVE